MQVLKESVRNKITLETTKLVVLNGIDKITMRTIAKKCNMTVGNLYRYFNSKDEIIIEIITPVVQELNKMLKSVTNNENININEKIEVDKINYNINLLVEKLVDINFKYELAMRVLAVDKNFNNEIQKWLNSVLLIVLKNKYDFEHVDELANMLASSLITGVNSCFASISVKKYNQKEVKEILRNYLGILLGGNGNEFY